MKKLMILMLAIAMLFSFTACDNSTKAQDDQQIEEDNKPDDQQPGGENTPERSFLKEVKMNKEFIQAIEEAIGRPAEKIFLPMQPGDVYQTNADTTSLQKELGFKPDKPIKEGVKETIEWYRSFYHI